MTYFLQITLISRKEGGYVQYYLRGEVSEWLKEHAWKACRRATVSRVRIPSSPPRNMTRLHVSSYFLTVESSNPRRQLRWRNRWFGAASEAKKCLHFFANERRRPEADIPSYGKLRKQTEERKDIPLNKYPDKSSKY